MTDLKKPRAVLDFSGVEDASVGEITPRSPLKASSNATRANRAAQLMKQVSDGTRLQILMMLEGGEMHVTAMCEALGNMGQPACSHHVALLRHGGLVEPRRQNKNNFYSLTPKGAGLIRAVRAIVEAQT